MRPAEDDNAYSDDDLAMDLDECDGCGYFHCRCESGSRCSFCGCLDEECYCYDSSLTEYCAFCRATSCDCDSLELHGPNAYCSLTGELLVSCSCEFCDPTDLAVEPSPDADIPF